MLRVALVLRSTEVIPEFFDLFIHTFVYAKIREFSFAWLIGSLVETGKLKNSKVETGGLKMES